MGKRPSIRVSHVIAHKYPFNTEEFATWAENNGFDHEEILRVSEVLGNEIHKKVEDGEIEIPLKHKTAKHELPIETKDFRGTLDLLLDDEILIDVKTYGYWRDVLDPTYENFKASPDKLKKLRLQLGGYCIGLEEQGIKVKECYLWHIHPKGSYLKKVKPNIKGFKKALQQYKDYLYFKEIL